MEDSMSGAGENVETMPHDPRMLMWQGWDRACQENEPGAPDRGREKRSIGDDVQMVCGY